jgi:hypothetical protein
MKQGIERLECNKILGRISMSLRIIGILYLFLLQYYSKINIPTSVITLITLGSLGNAVFIEIKDTTDQIYGMVMNYILALAGIIILCKKFGSKI